MIYCLIQVELNNHGDKKGSQNLREEIHTEATVMNSIHNARQNKKAHICSSELLQDASTLWAAFQRQEIFLSMFLKVSFSHVCLKNSVSLCYHVGASQNSQCYLASLFFYNNVPVLCHFFLKVLFSSVVIRFNLQQRYSDYALLFK